MSLISSKGDRVPLAWCFGRVTEELRRLRVPEELDPFLVLFEEKYDHMPGWSTLLDIA